MGLFSNLFGRSSVVNGPEAAPLDLGSNSMETFGTFQMKVDGVFSIRGRGTVATGVVSSGEAHSGNDVMVKKQSGEQFMAKITGIETMKKSAPGAMAGQKVGILLGSLDKSKIEKGDLISGESPTNKIV